VAEEAPPDHPGGALAGLAMAGVLAAAYLTTGSREADGTAFRAGAADAARILSGEVWRTATALTLHADASHLVANATAIALLGAAVCRTLGPGVGVALVVASGILGNAVNALLRGPPHVSVGASTAVLGAIGVLSGLAFTRQRRLPRRRARAWLPLAAGLALLGMLGSDPRSDLGAHFFGFIAGIGLGATTGLVTRGPARPRTQGALLAASLAVLLASWACALAA
jgi:membrane associated rhomboid family serine protease